MTKFNFPLDLGLPWTGLLKLMGLFGNASGW